MRIRYNIDLFYHIPDLALAKLVTWTNIIKMKAASGVFSCFTAVQQFHSYSQDRLSWTWNCITPEFIEMAKTRHDFNLLAYDPLLKGAYVRGEFQSWYDQKSRFDTADGHARLECVNGLAREMGVSANLLVLANVMHTEPGILLIFGAEFDRATE